MDTAKRRDKLWSSINKTTVSASALTTLVKSTTRADVSSTSTLLGAGGTRHTFGAALTSDSLNSSRFLPAELKPVKPAWCPDSKLDMTKAPLGLIDPEDENNTQEVIIKRVVSEDDEICCKDPVQGETQSRVPSARDRRELKPVKLAWCPDSKLDMTKAPLGLIDPEDEINTVGAALPSFRCNSRRILLAASPPSTESGRMRNARTSLPPIITKLSENAKRLLQKYAAQGQGPLDLIDPEDENNTQEVIIKRVVSEDDEICCKDPVQGETQSKVPSARDRRELKPVKLAWCPDSKLDMTKAPLGLIDPEDEINTVGAALPSFRCNSRRILLAASPPSTESGRMRNARTSLPPIITKLSENAKRLLQEYAAQGQDKKDTQESNGVMETQASRKRVTNKRSVSEDASVINKGLVSAAVPPMTTATCFSREAATSPDDMNGEISRTPVTTWMGEHTSRSVKIHANSTHHNSQTCLCEIAKKCLSQSYGYASVQRHATDLTHEESEQRDGEEKKKSEVQGMKHKKKNKWWRRLLCFLPCFSAK
ncbi:uncharacterized protein LOC143476988 [Brachyhypopomus gauderio]|uniref:uncharacterized protein LOC143476988 n=1 Tax=Brachyhypopomus gauderio TaxID=698409 RepID=UPI004042EDC6